MIFGKHYRAEKMQSFFSLPCITRDFVSGFEVHMKFPFGNLGSIEGF